MKKAVPKPARRTVAAPSVDVVVVSWNTRDELHSCIDSVLASTGVKVNLIVVDNASADGSADAARAVRGVKVIANSANVGFARGANAGAAAGISPWILLLNPDTAVSPSTIAELVERMEGLPRHAAAAPRLLYEDGTPQHSAYRTPSLGMSLLLNTGLQKALPRRWRSRLLLEGSWESDEERDVPWVIGAALLVRRSAWDRLGPLDEGFFMYAEDLEWCDRANRAGMPIRFIPSIAVTHLGNRSGSQRYGDDRVGAYLRSTLRFARRRHGPAWTAAFALINAAGTVPRYAAWRAVAAGRPTPRAVAGIQQWRPYARFYLGRSRPAP